MSLGGGGGEIPKGGCAGRVRSLGIWPGGGEISRDLAPGGRDHAEGRNPWDTGIKKVTPGVSHVELSFSRRRVNFSFFAE